MVAIAAAIVSAPVVASRTTAMKPASKAVSFKAANVAAKKTNAFQVSYCCLIVNVAGQWASSASMESMDKEGRLQLPTTLSMTDFVLFES
jgi:hypothetical protein